MKNIEIKARYPNLEQAREIALEMGAEPQGLLIQRDTYYNVKSGRLKLREIKGQETQLIYYNRADTIGPKESTYDILPVANELLPQILENALGIRTVVIKRRELLLFDEVRIHLDDVDGLGKFIELEGVVRHEATEKATRRKVDILIEKLEISPDNLVEGSYSDMIGQQF